MTTSVPTTPAPIAPPEALSPTDASSEAAVLTCTSCGGDNARDSRFCRHCGASLLKGEAALPVGAIPVATAAVSPVAAATAQPVNGTTANGATDNGKATSQSATQSESSNEDHLGGAEEVDKGRANHLLERAERLSERGEWAPAILACRQAIALSPQLVGGYALLGDLLERVKDTKGAINAYEHVVELWPDSPIERERLRELRAQAAQNTSSSVFHFDANELFPDTPTTVAPITVAPIAVTPVTVTADTAADAATPVSETVSVEAVTPAVPDQKVEVSGTPIAASAFAAGTLAPLAAGQGAISASGGSISGTSANGVPKLTPARVALPTSAALTSVPSISALPPSGAGSSLAGMGLNDITMSAGSAPTFAPLALEPERVAVRRWDSSYFWRGAPLAATVGTGLLFLIWAANWSAARRSEVVVPAAPDTTFMIDDGSVPPSSAITGPARLSAGVPGGGPNEILPGDIPPSANVAATNVPARPANNTNAGTGTNPTSGTSNPASGGTRAGNTGRGNNSLRSVLGSGTTGQPRFGSVTPPVRPVPVTPESVVQPNTDNSPPRMTPPRLPETGRPPITLGNGDNGAGSGASTGGAPINPVYNGGRGFIRLHNGTGVASSAPSRPSNQAGSSERDAGNAARSGQGSRAVADASSAINRTTAGDPNLGFRYQTRALLFLEQGDNARAIDDFNTAIQAYQEQIARGDQDQDARTGLEACRRGLRLAQRRLGR